MSDFTPDQERELKRIADEALEKKRFEAFRLAYRQMMRSMFYYYNPHLTHFSKRDPYVSLSKEEYDGFKTFMEHIDTLDEADMNAVLQHMSEFSENFERYNQ